MVSISKILLHSWELQSVGVNARANGCFSMWPLAELATCSGCNPVAPPSSEDSWNRLQHPRSTGEATIENDIYINRWMNECSSPSTKSPNNSVHYLSHGPVEGALSVQESVAAWPKAETPLQTLPVLREAKY